MDFPTLDPDVLGGLNRIIQNIQSGQGNPDDDLNIQRIFAQFKPEHAASDKLMEMFNQFPQRGTPSKTSNVLGALAGLGEGARPSAYEGGAALGFEGGSTQNALNASELIRFRPFYNQLADWQARARPLEQAAQNERYANTVNLRSINDAAARAISLKRAQNQEVDIAGKNRARGAKILTDQQRVEIAKKRADAYDFDKRNPSWTKYATPGGNLIFINPKDPSQVYDTGLDSGLDEARELMKTKHEYTTQEIEKRGEVEKGNIQERGKEQRQTNLEKPVVPRAGRGGTGNASLEAMRSRVMRAEKYFAEHPESQQYFNITGNNITPKPPSNWSYWADQNKKIYNDAVEAIFNQEEPTPVSGTTEPPPSNQGKKYEGEEAKIAMEAEKQIREAGYKGLITDDMRERTMNKIRAEMKVKK